MDKTHLLCARRLLPAPLLVDAVVWAQLRPLAPVQDDPRPHPALARLCGWWNAQAPSGFARAEAFLLWRHDGRGGYVQAARLGPVVTARVLAAQAAASARACENLLVQFVALDGPDRRYVNGHPCPWRVDAAASLLALARLPALLADWRDGGW